jgi:hypothetical protein
MTNFEKLKNEITVQGIAEYVERCYCLKCPVNSEYCASSPEDVTCEQLVFCNIHLM